MFYKGMSRALSLLCLLLVTGNSSPISVGMDPTGPTGPYNYYEFAVQNWVDGNYQIHGLWPSYSPGKYPSECGGSTYVRVDGTLLDSMEKYWNANPDQNQQFWYHEWSKHGTCVERQTGANETAYFEQALTLFVTLLPENSTWTCGAETDCIVACYDLNYTRTSCDQPPRF